MHYGIITFGSRGDVQPYIALAQELTGRGNTVGIAGNENFSDFVRSYGIPFYALPGNTQKMLQSSEMTGILRSGNVIAYLRELRKLMQPEQERILEKMVDYCAAFDVLIATPLTMVWVFSVAEKLKKPWAVVQLTIPSVPTAAFPYMALHFFDTPVYNRFTYRLMRWLFWKENKKEVQAQRAILKLQPLEKSLLKKMDEQQILQLHAFSRFLIQRPSDWPAEAAITGFLKLPETKEGSAGIDPAAMISDWLGQGAPPVYIGFGSIPVPDPELFYTILEYLLRNTEERYIFCQGWSQPVALPEDDRLLIIKAAAHSWLFPQCKLAVIHGGIGTIGAALRARLPVVVVSIFGDQPVWGRFIEKKGWGTHIRFRKLTAQKLLSAIRTADQATVRTSVQHMGSMMEQENGTAEAASRLETYFKLSAQALNSEPVMM
ncbi:glycosyltransferase [Niabella beijingensis]|uniref:glycosyltransferase n=1 Tax=Niabella beijingensis TaxID=2872700 RepID=UPI001CBD5493|nr:glycosyltransferase [Niabella beijingensis]MBZ4188764.1 glycosyltransferase [Niabella beijingensis]